MASVFEFWDVWLPVAFIAMALTSALIALIWILSEVLQNDRMKGWAKMELVELFYSAIILSMAITGLPIIDQLIEGALIGSGGGSGAVTTWVYYDVDGARQWVLTDICDNNNDIIGQAETSVYHGVESCHMRLGIWYLRELFDETKNFAFDIYVSYIFTSMIAEFTINIESLFEKAGFFTFTPWKGFFTMGNNIKGVVFDWAIKMMMIQKFQEVMLRFISVALFPALFVIGAVLRTFSLTRRLGGLLLAMAITLYFFYPAFYAFGAMVILGIKNDASVQAAWNAPDNPARNAIDNPNPPIANMMYAIGNFSMIGGDGVFKIDDAHNSLKEYQGMTSDNYFDYLERRDRGTNVRVDLSSTEYENVGEVEKEASYFAAWQKGQEWFTAVSKQNKFDPFISAAWKPNGPVDTMARITFWSVFFSLFSIIGTIAIIRSLSITFGGDIEIAGLTRLI